MTKAAISLALLIALGATSVHGQTAEELINDTSTTGDVLTYGMG